MILRIYLHIIMVDLREKIFLDASPKVQSQEFKEASGPLWALDQSLGVFSRISIDQFYLITSIELNPYFNVFNAWWPFSFIFYFIFFSIDAS